MLFLVFFFLANLHFFCSSIFCYYVALLAKKTFRLCGTSIQSEVKPHLFKALLFVIQLKYENFHVYEAFTRVGDPPGSLNSVVLYYGTSHNLGVAR